ncbi:hypothetical protein G6F22_020586 [Rhizopus arrhizus]|nr:hypothetical protein G6F22_020586 [Rhizopus arrhizus]
MSTSTAQCCGWNVHPEPSAQRASTARSVASGGAARKCGTGTAGGGDITGSGAATAAGPLTASGPSAAKAPTPAIATGSDCAGAAAMFARSSSRSALAAKRPPRKRSTAHSPFTTT